MDDLSREVTRKERDAINSLGVHVMITSRAENLPFRKMKLEYLDEDNAVRMFFGYYDGESGDAETARKIVRSVKSHTLLVELLAKAAKEEGGTLEEFYENLTENGFFDVSDDEIETEHDDENRTIEESVIRLYRISGLSKEQQRIMKLFTIFTPEKEIYYKVRDWAGFDRKEMKKLTDLGWLERGGLEKGYFIHQIVKDSVAKQMEKDRETVILEEYGEFLERVKDTNSYMDKAVPYEYVRERLVLTEDVARFFDESGRADETAGTLFNNMAEVYRAQGNYGKALEYNEKALAIREKVLGKAHPYTAITYNNMAHVYYSQKNYEKAMEYLKKAHQVFLSVFGENHPNTQNTAKGIRVTEQMLDKK
jgi:tetratricopeptide (TPR) repeat protein